MLYSRIKIKPWLSEWLIRCYRFDTEKNPRKKKAGKFTKGQVMVIMSKVRSCCKTKITLVNLWLTARCNFTY